MFDTLERVVEVITGQPFDRFACERILDPLGSKDTTYRPSTEQFSRIATQYRGADGELTRVDSKLIWMKNPTYFSGGGGLMSSAEGYFQFAQTGASAGTAHSELTFGSIQRRLSRYSYGHVPWSGLRDISAVLVGQFPVCCRHSVVARGRGFRALARPQRLIAGAVAVGIWAGTHQTILLLITT